MSDNQQIAAFELAGPIMPQVDLDQLLSARNNTGIYTVGPGDVLEIQMPTIMTAVSPKLYKDQKLQVEPYLCRITDAGTITLPILGQMNVDGKTLAGIEDEIVNSYYPRYVISRPSVVCGVKEYHFTNITVVGAVVSPGVYRLKSDEMSLVNALMKAGGIVEDGASIITIRNPNRNYVRYAKIDANGDEVKQWVDFGDEINTDLSDLQFDLVFQPENSSQTQGNLLVRQENNTLYSKKINIENQYQRTEYIKDLKTVIGDEQGDIAGHALEQLVVQFSSTITASQTRQLSAEETELLDAADDLRRDNTESPAAPVTEGCTGCNQKYIEMQHNEPLQLESVSTIEETREVNFEPAANTDEIEFIEPSESDYAPAAETGYAEFTEPRADYQDTETAQPAQGDYEPAESDYAPAAQTTTETVKAIVEPVVLPVKGLNIPFADIPLVEGDLIEVKRLNPAVFTVIGLANQPGAFPYPPDAEYNLMQALGFAGGVDLIADPRFVTVYRQNAAGEVVNATFRIDRQFQAKSYGVKIKPGDVISVEVTPRTKTNVILHQVLRINFGLYVDPFNND